MVTGRSTSLMMLISLLLIFFGVTREALSLPACRISQFPCRNNKCIRLDHFCDGINNCGDLSDEPPYCSACNRTYYGDEGTTYELNLGKPNPERMPFICHLTFTANGHTNGDFIQLLFDSFQIGRFDNRSYEGCPDGYMQIMELGRPFNGGSWCGGASGLTVYYSETSTITVSLRLHYALAVSNFSFKLRYRFVADDQAVVRFGSSLAPLNRGEVVPGTYCSRNFYECYRRRCLLQSPNFPGFYPRNITCMLTIKQKQLPTCKHALIAIKQIDSKKIQIKRSVAVASLNRTRALKTWSDCPVHVDQLIIYDGPSTEDPVLVRFCGGDWLPQITSRGPEMLLAFHSSAFSMPLDDHSSSSNIRGFELDVNVVFVDSGSLDYTREARRCEFWLNASSPDGDEVSLRSKGRSGYLLSPRHTLAPNTTCTWHLHGQSKDLVWVYFLSFVNEKLEPQTVGNAKGSSNRNLATQTKCSTLIRLWDGSNRSSQIMGDHCDGDRLKLCDHTSLSNITRATRPCNSMESYQSNGRDMLIEMSTQSGTAIAPAGFRLWYEFIDTRLGGEAWAGRRGEPSFSCMRLFRKQRRGEFHSPRNVFLYGRGGATNLTCLYRIEASPSERIKLTLLNASFGENSCTTDMDPHTGRPRCLPDPTANRKVHLRVFQSHWKDLSIPYACFCDNSTVPNSSSDGKPFVFTSSSRAIELEFHISNFNIAEDYTHLYFNAEFETVKSSECVRKQRVSGSGGEMVFVSPPLSVADVACADIPWFVEARQNTSLFLLTWGLYMTDEPGPEELAKCPTRNRVFVYSGKPLKLLKIVCPTTPNTRPYAVHLFSEEWFSSPSIPLDASTTLHLAPPRPPSFLVEFFAAEAGTAQVNWLEISRTRTSYLQALHVDLQVHESLNDSKLLRECLHRCPELNACISGSLWCDGRAHCPSGFDELEMHCGAGHRIISLIPGGLFALLGTATAIVTFAALFVAVIVINNMKKDKKSREMFSGSLCGPPRRVPTDELLLAPPS